MAGICLIVGVQAFESLGRELVAQLAIVAATICYAGAAVFSRGFKGLDPMAPAAGSLICGAAVLIPFSIVMERPWTLAPSATSLLALLGLAIFSTAFALVICRERSTSRFSFRLSVAKTSHGSGPIPNCAVTSPNPIDRDRR